MEILRKNREIKPIPEFAKPKNTKLVIKKDLKKTGLYICWPFL